MKRKFLCFLVCILSLSPYHVVFAEDCEELASQNQSLRETIRAQNEYLLSKDGSSKINNKIANENADLKNKVYYLEGAVKSGSEEIKRLMILNEQLQAELKQYKGK